MDLHPLGKHADNGRFAVRLLYYHAAIERMIIETGMVVDVRDSVAVAATALTEPGAESRIWVFAGPEVLTRAESARSLQNGRRLRIDSPHSQGRLPLRRQPPPGSRCFRLSKS